jgi:hypothetical protein
MERKPCMQTSSTTPRRAKDPRSHLVPIAGGPWLDDRSHTTFCRHMGLGGLGTAVVSLLIGAAPTAVKGFWYFLVLAGALAAVFGGLGYIVGLLARHTTQTCPACLCGMPRGAATCPHCHFHPPQEVP